MEKVLLLTTDMLQVAPFSRNSMMPLNYYMEQNTRSINFNVTYYSAFRIININFTETLYLLFERQPSPFYAFCEAVFLPYDG